MLTDLHMLTCSRNFKTKICLVLKAKDTSVYKDLYALLGFIKKTVSNVLKWKTM